MKEPISVIGAEWVGLATAACFADLGHEVTVRDGRNEDVLASKRRRRSLSAR